MRHRHHLHHLGHRRFGMRHYVRARLHRRLFAWFGGAIILTGVLAAASMHLFGQGGARWKSEVERARTFASHRFAEVWDDPARRAELARSLDTDLALDVELKDAAGTTLLTAGNPLDRRAADVPVVRGGERVGTLRVGFSRHHSEPWDAALPIAVACLVLWAFSGRVARRLGRPLWELASVARQIGDGNLSARATIGCDEPGEVGMLAHSINEMAGRIEKQMADQRELLAAVSHELRTPLARIRLLVELGRDGEPAKKTFDEIDREVVEIDGLVGQLLASSRIDFGTLSRTPLDGRDVAARALERAGLPADKLDAPAEEVPLEADPTLLGRALANLLENAARHGGGVDRVRVRTDGDAVRFEVEDRGPGFAEGEAGKAFEPFFRRPKSGDGDKGLGLGLALVRRIAEAHGGRAWAENREGGGGRVGFSVARTTAA